MGRCFFCGSLPPRPATSSCLATYAALRPGDDRGRAVVAVVGGTLFLQVFEVVESWFQANVQSRYVVWPRMFAFAVASVLRVALIRGQASVLAFAWTLLLEGVLVSLGMVYFYHRSQQRMTAWRYDAGRAKELLASSWPLIFEGLMIVIYLRIDQIMLGLMAGNKAAGIYGAATRISEVWYFIPAALVESVTPALLRSKHASESLYYSRISRLFSLLVLISLGVALSLSLGSSLIVGLLFGPSYAAAAPILAVHAWAAPFVFLGVAQNPWNINEGLTVLSFRRAAIGAVSNFVLNLFLIPRFAGLGAAIATVISYSFASFFSNAIDRRTRRIFFLQLRAFTFKDLLA